MFLVEIWYTGIIKCKRGIKMENMIRKSMLYKTGVEYGDYTINHVLGCSHGCNYPCYAMMLAKRFGKVKNYKDWCKPKLAVNTLEILTKEIPKYKKNVKSVHLCFTTDPFMYGYDEISSMSIEIIKMLNSNGIKATALTKGLLPKELANLSSDNEYGITLVSLNEDFRSKYEPGAASYEDRISALKYLHKHGCKTWVSIEPYPTPNIIDQEYSKILESVKFVDKIIFGRLNYNPLVNKYRGYKEYFNNLAYQTIEFCDSTNMEYHIKDGTITENVQCI
jgi:DNA repair photolyase